jgi:hypothetical protein
MRLVAIILFIFFSPISAAGFIASEERLHEFELQRYPEIFQNGKLALRTRLDGIVLTSFLESRRPSLGPETALFLPSGPSDLGIKLSPQIYYEFIEPSYSIGWTLLGTILNVFAPTYGEIKMHRNGSSFWQTRMRVINELDPASRDLYQ